MSSIKDTIGDISKSVFKVSSDLIMNTKTSLKLSAEESKLKDIYIEIGKQVAEIYKYGGKIGDYFDEQYAKLSEQEEKIAMLKLALNKKDAPEKKDMNDLEHKNIEHKNIENENKSIDKDDAGRQNNIQSDKSIIKIKCKVCGSLNDEAEKFCMGCGRML